MNSESASPASQGLRILRIKRKRDEDVPDVLVVEPSSKKGSKRRKSALDVFQRAETVDIRKWSDLREAELRNRISQKSKLGLEENIPATPGPPAWQGSAQSNKPAKHYRVVIEEGAPRKRPSRHDPQPPKVLSSKDLNKSTSLTIYDAVLDEPVQDVSPEESLEMDKFQSLLKEYLNISDSGLLPGTSSVRSNLSSSSRLSTSSSAGDYVYDIFYYRPSTVAEQAAAAGMGMATVSGVPAEVDDDNDSSSGSEIEDEADEDSNAEEYYKNDYPDEESSEDESDIHSNPYSEDDFDDSGRFEPE